MKRFRVTGNDRENPTTGHGEAFEEIVEAETDAMAELIARRRRVRAGRFHILIAPPVELTD
jgi:hypothetical protein